MLRQIMAQAALYVDYARKAVKWQVDDAVEVAKTIRQIALTRRGLGEDFYRQVALQYDALFAGGEAHPVKALSQIHHVTISAASRWIKGARDRGLIEKKPQG